MDELGEDLLLLAVSSDGTLAIPTKLRYGLAGSELVRLAAARRVDIVRGRIVIRDATPTGDSLLNEALASMAGGRREPTAKVWVARHRPGLVERYLARAEASGAIHAQKRKVLGFIPITRWMVVDTARTPPSAPPPKQPPVPQWTRPSGLPPTRPSAQRLPPPPKLRFRPRPRPPITTAGTVARWAATTKPGHRVPGDAAGARGWPRHGHCLLPKQFASARPRRRLPGPSLSCGGPWRTPGGSGRPPRSSPRTVRRAAGRRARCAGGAAAGWTGPAPGRRRT